MKEEERDGERGWKMLQNSAERVRVRDSESERERRQERESEKGRDEKRGSGKCLFTGFSSQCTG